MERDTTYLGDSTGSKTAQDTSRQQSHNLWTYTGIGYTDVTQSRNSTATSTQSEQEFTDGSKTTHASFSTLSSTHNRTATSEDGYYHLTYQAVDTSNEQSYKFDRQDNATGYSWTEEGRIKIYRQEYDDQYDDSNNYLDLDYFYEAWWSRSFTFNRETGVGTWSQSGGWQSTLNGISDGSSYLRSGTSGEISAPTGILPPLPTFPALDPLLPNDPNTGNGGGGGGGTPPDAPSDYLERFSLTLDKTIDQLAEPLKAQLSQLKDTLMASAELVHDGEFYELVDATFYGIFSSVLNAQSMSSVQSVADSLAWFLQSQQQTTPPPQAGQPSQWSLKQQVFQTTVLTAAKVAQLPVEENQDLKNEILALADAYSQLEPIKVNEQLEELPKFFLDTLWNAESVQIIHAGIGELVSFLQDFDQPEKLIQYQRKLLTVLNSVTDFQESLKSSSFAKQIFELAKNYALFRINNTGYIEDATEDAEESLLDEIWDADNETSLKIIASQVQNPSEGKFPTKEANLYEYISSRRGRRSLVGGVQILRPYDINVLRRSIRIRFRDYEQRDGDKVTVTLNGQLLWPGVIDLDLFSELIPLYIDVAPINSGENTLTITSVSTGTLGPTTVNFEIVDPVDPIAHPNGYTRSIALEQDQSITFTIGFPQVALRRSIYPESAQHVEDAQAQGKARALTIDRDVFRRDARSNSSLASYPTLEGFHRDEYPPAMFLENYGSASVRYITPSDNTGAGSSFGNALRRYADGDVVEFTVIP